MNGNEAWMMVLMFLPIVFITAITPLITRKIEAFGVTVQEGTKEQPFLKGLIKRYIWLCSALGLILMVTMLLLLLNVSGEPQVVSVVLTHYMGYLLISFIIYYVNHRKVKEWKQQQAWNHELMNSHKVMVQTAFHSRKTTVSMLWFIPHLVLVGITVLVSVINYDKFPELIPVQYDLSGEVTRTVEKSMSSVMWLSWLAAAVTIVFIFSTYMIGKAKQLVESRDPEGSLERNIRFRYSWSVYMVVVGFLTAALMCIIQLSPIYDVLNSSVGSIIIGFVVIVLIGSIALSLFTGQGGSRIKLKADNQKQAEPVADHDKYWKAGIFYFNPKDPSLFVEKRFGIGWTLNLGNPLGWLIFIGILAIVLIPSFFLSK